MIPRIRLQATATAIRKLRYIKHVLERKGLRFTLLFGASLLGLLLLSGCGGGSTTTALGGSISKPSAQFQKTKGKHAIADFGQEAPIGERKEVSAVLTENLKARAAANFATQCRTLNAKGIGKIPGNKTRAECPKALKEFAEPLTLTEEIRKNTLSGPISAFRVKGDRGYALYHGNDGKNYAMPMEKEGGIWRVSSLTTVELGAGSSQRSA